MNILIIGKSSHISKNLIRVFKGSKKKNNIFCTSSKIKKNDIKNKVLKLDLLKNEDIKNFSEFINKKKILFDLVVFNNGICHGLNLKNHNLKTIQESYKLNLFGNIIISKIIEKKLSKESKFIFISSIASHKGSYDPIYSSFKSALVGLTKSLTSYLSPNTKVLCLVPGIISKTAMYGNFSKKVLKNHLKRTSNKHFVNANEIAKIIYDLSQHHWRHANGSIIELNGGYI